MGEHREAFGQLEYFDTYDEQGVHLGRAPRDFVHQQGMWHKSAQVFVFDQNGALLIQRRASDKDLYANLWDYSVGEHLQPGETFIDGARRGLQEELGIRGVALDLLGGVRLVRQSGPGYDDREIQQAFRCCWSGPIQADDGEVAEVRFIDLLALHAWVEQEPGEFTPWFKQDLEEFGLI